MKTAPSTNEILFNQRTKPNARKVVKSEWNFWIAEEKRNSTQQMGSASRNDENHRSNKTSIGRS
jgi:hypothetical protein